MTILFRPQGAFGWFSYTTSRDTIDIQADGVDDAPRLGQMCWPGGRSATLLYWQSEPWVKMRDMPVVLAGEVELQGPAEKRKLSWRECAQRALRMHGI
ncbi:hypothetical protein O999_10520 [Pseudomonas putida LF54]|nr:hypothetical protein O999_10520 [Pseudomonas putida LF54]